MKKSKANQIIKKWNECFAGRTEVTKTIAVLYKYKRNLGYGVDINPCGYNNGTSFHHTQELALIEKFYDVGAWIALRSCEGYDHKVVYAHIV